MPTVFEIWRKFMRVAEPSSSSDIQVDITDPPGSLIQGDDDVHDVLLTKKFVAATHSAIDPDLVRTSNERVPAHLAANCK